MPRRTREDRLTVRLTSDEGLFLERLAAGLGSTRSDAVRFLIFKESVEHEAIARGRHLDPMEAIRIAASEAPCCRTHRPTVRHTLIPPSGPGGSDGAGSRSGRPEERAS